MGQDNNDEKRTSLDDLVRKQDKAYQEGLHFGQLAQAPPSDFNKLVTEVDTSHSSGIQATTVPNMDHNRISFQYGYFDGLYQFLNLHNMKHPALPLLDLFSSNDAIGYFTDGLNLLPFSEKSPEFDDTNFLKYNQDFLRNQNPGINKVNLEAYCLGFRIALAKKYGALFGTGQVPYDINTYIGFIQGLNGEPRFKKQMPGPEEKHYRDGLLIWLFAQGYENDVEPFLDPIFLEAFRAGLEGQEIERYQQESVTFKMLSEFDVIRARGELRGSSPAVEFKMGICGYMEGKKLRNANLRRI
jgi:hypothetical protein